jgi:hypothetical protein
VRDIQRAFATQKSNLQVSAQGRIVKSLPDDIEGDRHQRFLVQLSPQLTILIAHNIDIAPKIDTLKVGNRIQFYGEYEWNELGGVVHWTHHDPQQRHPNGWLKYLGRTYQ